MPHTNIDGYDYATNYNQLNDASRFTNDYRRQQNDENAATSAALLAVSQIPMMLQILQHNISRMWHPALIGLKMKPRYLNKYYREVKRKKHLKKKTKRRRKYKKSKNELNSIIY